MAFDPTQILLGAGITALLGVVAFFGRRIITNESARENAALYSSYATIASTLKSQGITLEDVDRIATFLRTNETRKKIKEAEESAADSSGSGNIEPYWTQTAMNSRAGAAEGVAKAQLDAAIAELNGLLSPEEEDAFVAAQDAWTEYRNKQADFAAIEVAGGSLEPLIRSSEKEALNIQRAAALRAIAKQRMDH